MLYVLRFPYTPQMRKEKSKRAKIFQGKKQISRTFTRESVSFALKYSAISFSPLPVGIPAMATPI